MSALGPRTARVLFYTASLLSGVAALIYQLLWIRRLGELFGHATYAVTVVLAVFFGGVGVGAWLVGRLSDRLKGSVVVFCGMELVLAAYGIVFWFLCDILDAIYLSFAPAEWELGSALLLKGLSTAVLLAVPTMAMGGTLPALIRHEARASRQRGSGVGVLYGANAIGGALGLALATLWLIPRFGVHAAAYAAVLSNILAGGLAWRGRRTLAIEEDEPSKARGSQPSRARPAPRASDGIRWLSAASGFLVVGLEVLWIRALSSRFLNTVYSYATITVVFLFALGVGGLIIAWLDRWRGLRRSNPGAFLLAGGICGLSSIALLDRVPSTSASLGTDIGGLAAFLTELEHATMVMAVPAIVLGLTFPALIRLARRDMRTLGGEIGWVYLTNTAGAVVAPLLVGFILLPGLGIRGSLVTLSWLAILCGAAGLLTATGPVQRGTRALVAGVVAGALIFSLALPRDIRLWRTAPRDRLLEYREGLTASIAVLQDGTGDVILKLDSDYRLGSVHTAFAQHRQGLIPLLIRPDSRRALFIGMGTGSSAGAAAAYGDVSVDVLEIVPELVDLLGHFRSSNEDLAKRLHAGSNVRVLPVDGRQFVRSTKREYDVVVGDLFVPSRAGEGAMYTKEHLESIRGVLGPAGLFCQWLPLYQFSPHDLKTVVATFCDVFPAVEAWWLYFNIDQPVIGLIGTNDPRRLDVRALGISLKDPRHRELVQRAGLVEWGPLVGSWIADRASLSEWSRGTEVETWDRPRIEFSAPIHRIGARRDVSIANTEAMLSLGQPIDGSYLLTGNDPESISIARNYQLSVSCFFRAGVLRATGAPMSLILEEFGKALALTPSWDWIAWNVDQLTQAAIDSRDHDSATIGAHLLQRNDARRHRGYYYGAMLALAAGDRDLARSLLKVALDIAPGDATTTRLLREIEPVPPVGADKEPR